VKAENENQPGAGTTTAAQSSRKTIYRCYYTMMGASISIIATGDTPAKRQLDMLKQLSEQYPDYTFQKIEIFDMPSKYEAMKEKGFLGIKKLSELTLEDFLQEAA